MGCRRDVVGVRLGEGAWGGEDLWPMEANESGLTTASQEASLASERAVAHEGLHARSERCGLSRKRCVLERTVKGILLHKQDRV